MGKNLTERGTATKKDQDEINDRKKYPKNKEQIPNKDSKKE